VPDELTRPARHVTGGGSLRDALLLLTLFAVGGALAGLVWNWLWSPPTGIVLDGVWYPEGDGVSGVFAGTGLYVLVAAGTGVVLGVLSGLLADRRELLTLALVVVGSSLAAGVMVLVGTLDTPPDPQPIAARADDYTRLPGQLEVGGASPHVALPIGAVAGLCTMFIGLARKPHDDPRPEHADG
jgi:hypothetical protein